MDGENPSKSICFACLSSFEITNKLSNWNDITLNQLYLQFESFTKRYLELRNEFSLKNCGSLKGFCEPCVIRVKRILELYSELCEVELRLTSELGELGHIIKESNWSNKPGDSQVLPTLQDEDDQDEDEKVSGFPLEVLRNFVATKCLQKYEELHDHRNAGQDYGGWDLRDLQEQLFDEDEELQEREEEENKIKEEVESSEENWGETNDELDPLADRTFPSTSKSIPHTVTLASFECRGRRSSFLPFNSDEESMSISSESVTNDDDDVTISEFVSNSKASSESSDENSTQEIDSEEEVNNNNDEEPSPGRHSLRRVANGVHGQRRRGRGRPKKLNSDYSQTKQSFTTFLCQQCGKGHSTELRLYKHLLLHEKQSRKKGNPCCFCYLSFVSEQADKLHMKRYHRSILTKAKPFSCTEKACKESFATLPELNDHLKAHSTNEDIPYCSVCRWGFMNEDLLKLHELVHTPKRSGGGFQCPSCPSFSFKNVIFLQNHYNHKHGSNLGGFKCPECDLSLATESSLRKHLKRHEDPEIDGNITEKANCVAPPPCSVCGLQFLHLKYLDKHRKDVHNLGVECPTCHKLVSCRTSLLRHNQNVHQPPGKDTRHPCPYCGVTWRTRHYLYEHIAVHHPNERGVEGKHECPGCNEKFARNVTLWKHLSECDFYPEKEKTKIKIQHKRATNPTRPYQSVSCHICGKPVQKMKLQIHLNTHLGAEEKEEHPCDKCKRVFGSEHLLRKHLKLTHKYVGEGEDIQHVCEVCGMVLANNPSLKRHVEAHAGEKKFSCHLCESKFTAKTTLKSHLNNLHGKPKGEEFTPGEGELPNNFKYPHNCMSLNCGERFATEMERKVHVERSHFVENEQEFMCKLCGKVFANQTRLTRHYLIHTKEKPHKCHVCSKAFAHKSTLKEHLEAIHDEGKEKLFFRCDQPNCDATFKCRNYIFKHLRKVHGVYTAKPKNK